VNIPRVLAAFAMAAACGMAALCQQQQPSGYYSVLCLKVNPGKGAEHRKFWEEEGRRVMQAMIDSGGLTTYYRLGAVVPSGTSATCDLVSVSFYPGLPTDPPHREQYEAFLKKAGITESAQDYLTRRDASRTTVSSEIFHSEAMLGSIKKGDYVSVSYMKTAHIDDWLTMEKTIWQPLADVMIKEGVQSGWAVSQLIMPR